MFKLTACESSIDYLLDLAKNKGLTLEQVFSNSSFVKSARLIGKKFGGKKTKIIIINNKIEKKYV